MMTHMRTIIDLPAPQLEALDALCAREGISRAEAIRRAVAAHLEAHRAAAPDEAWGLWRGRGLDGLVYQAQLRAEWDAPAGANALIGQSAMPGRIRRKGVRARAGRPAAAPRKKRR